jgi:hypothetical protein
MEPYYKRRFYDDETQEIRLYLRGGDDFVITRGGPHKNLKIRIIGGPGDDIIDDSDGGGLQVYDAMGIPKLIPGPGSKLNDREYNPPKVPTAPWLPPRDWGKQTISFPWISYGPDSGLFIGGGFFTQLFAFRKDPYSSRHTFRGGFAFGAKALSISYHGEFRSENSQVYTSLEARASGLEIFRFYGFGNETTSNKDDDFYKIQLRRYYLDLSFHLPLASSLSLSLGPIIKYSTTNMSQDNFISIIRPYGAGKFGQIGVHGRLSFDTRNNKSAATHGTHIFLDGKYFPALWDVESDFGYIRIESSIFLTGSSIPLQPTLALRAGGEHVFGKYPFHEAAFIGGGGLAHSGSTVRGFFAQRFAGDSAVYGNAELRIRLSDIYLLLPGEMGLFVLGDIGRVYIGGENSKKWHRAFGGGVWISFLDRKNTLSIALANSDERLGIYVTGGFLL